MLRAQFNDGWQVSENTSNFSFSHTKGKEPVMVTLPHDAVIHTERNPNAEVANKKGFYDNGSWVYKKKFTLPEEYTGKKVYIEFEGVYRNAMVYINGSFAGQERSGYAVFAVDAEPFLKPGENEVKVVATTGDDSRWYTGAGIYRDVNILVGGMTFIKPYGVKLTTPDIRSGLAVAEVCTTLHSDAQAPLVTTQVATEILDANGDMVASNTAPITVFRGQDATLRQRLYVKQPRLWGVDSPNLYTCRTRLLDSESNLLDQSEESFGFRTLTLDPECGLSINGESLKLRGACIHHDNGPLGAATYHSAEARRVRKLKQAGFNAIRMSHHPASPALLRACDEIGLLVMDEAFDMWTEGKTTADHALEIPREWAMDIRAMVDKDFNHPSVVLYSIGNEIQDTGTPHGSAWGRKMCQLLKELDPSRFTINGINGMVAVMELLIGMRGKNDEKAAEGKSGGGDTEINTMMNNMGAMMKQIMSSEMVSAATAESFACLDVAGYNYMDNRYEGDLEAFPGRIICGTETFPPDIENNWRLVKRYGSVLGDFTWTGWDYLGEAGVGQINYAAKQGNTGVYGGYPSLTAFTGDIDITGYRRPISYYRETVFGLRDKPYIAVQKPEHYGEQPIKSAWSWSDSVGSWSWDGFEGKPVKVEVYSASEEVELLVNGQPIGKQPAGDANKYMAVFDTVYQPGKIEAIAYDKGEETGRFWLESPHDDVRLAIMPEKTTVELGKEDLVYVDIALQDAAGNPHSDKEYKVALDVAGPAELVGYGTGACSTTENFFDKERTTFEGRALAIVRPTAAGVITLTAQANGLPGTRVEIKVIGERA